MLNKLCHLTDLSSQSTRSGSALTQRQRGQTVLRQQLHHIAKSLSQLYLSMSGTEGRNLGIVAAPLKHSFGWSIWYSCNIRTSPMRPEIVRSNVWLRAACTKSNHTCCEKCHHSEGLSDLGTLQSHFKTCTTLSFALLLNVRSQYPRANLKQLSLSL